MTPEQLNHEMRATGLQCDENVSKQQKILLILRYGTDRRPGITQPFIPKTSPKAAAAAAAVERRPIPQGGLTLQVLRDYTDDEIDVDLKHLGINHPAHLSRHAKIILSMKYYAPSRGEAEMQRAQAGTSRDAKARQH